MQLKEFKDRIYKAIATAMCQGKTITSGEFGVCYDLNDMEFECEDGECCPIGAILVTDQPGNDFTVTFLGIAAEHLRIPRVKISAFIDGVDGIKSDQSRRYRRWHAFGKEIRKSITGTETEVMVCF